MLASGAAVIGLIVFLIGMMLSFEFIEVSYRDFFSLKMLNAMVISSGVICFLGIFFLADPPPRY